MAQLLEITLLYKITTTNKGPRPVDDYDTYITASMAILLLKEYRYVIQET